MMLLFIFIVSSLTQLSFQLTVTDARLPRHIVPEAYEIHLAPSFQEDNFTLRGTVTIELDVLEESDNITLTVQDIKVKEVTLLNGIGEEVKIASTHEDKDKEFFIIHTEETLKVHENYKVTIEYQGELNDDLVGFYRSSYADSKGEIRWLGATQFQISDARRAFPCFDEPDFKAKFRVTILRPRNMTSISNMPKENIPDVLGIPLYETDYFTESVPMSTYLVAFCVSDFTFKDVSLPGGTPFRIYARKEAIANGQADFAGELSARILKFFEDYLGIPYPLPKLDQVALPDFAYGAMENWGLVTYRETALLLDKEVSSAEHILRVVSVIAHELAHMWFGNLVTPKWWNDIWLSEAFANHFDGLGVDHVRPSWGIREYKDSKSVQRALKKDALRSTEPIWIEKATALIRMMSMFITESTLRRGLAAYLTEFQYRNAKEADLWRHMTLQAHYDKTLPRDVTVEDIMYGWTTQEGFPLIKVERNYDANSANISQERFLLFSKRDVNEVDPSWWVPLSYTSQSKKDFNISQPSVWMRKGEKNIALDNIGANSEEWIIFNIQQAGYYRVCYDDKNWGLLAAQLEMDHLVIPSMQRSQILNDALSLARANRMDYSLALSLTPYLSREKSHTPLKTLLDEMDYVWRMLIRTPGAGHFMRYMKGIIYPLYAEVEKESWSTDYSDLLNVFWKVKVTEWACRLEHQGCIQEAQRQFRILSTNYTAETASKQINPNLKSTIYCTAIKFGTEKEWAFLWQHYNKTTVSSEKEAVLRALGCSRSVWILSRYISWVLDDSSGVRKQDGNAVFASVAKNPIARCLAWDFLRKNWKKVNGLYGDVFHNIRRFISSATRDFNTEKEIQQLKQFQEANKNDFGKAGTEVNQSVEKAEMNYEWMRNNYERVVQWFKWHKPLSTRKEEVGPTVEEETSTTIEVEFSTPKEPLSS